MHVTAGFREKKLNQKKNHPGKNRQEIKDDFPIPFFDKETSHAWRNQRRNAHHQHNRRKSPCTVLNFVNVTDNSCGSHHSHTSAQSLQKSHSDHHFNHWRKRTANGCQNVNSQSKKQRLFTSVFI